MKAFYVLTGHYGSGKTELALNFTIKDSHKGNSVLVDLDIVNPYFRSSEKGQLLKANNIKLIAPIFALTTVDVPALPPDILSVFAKTDGTIVFDVGGDPVGATALGSYRSNFLSIKPPDVLNVLYVINGRRPFSSHANEINEMLEQISDHSRLKITGLVNNTNLSVETTADDLLFGYELVKEVSIKSGVPVLYTTGRQNILNDFKSKIRTESLDENYIGNLWEICIYMHRDWDSFTELGV